MTRANELHCVFSASLNCCVFSNVSSKHLYKRMQNHIGCICSTSLRCAFSNVSSNRLPESMHSHNDGICLSFLHCVFSNVSSKCLPGRRHSYVGCSCLTLCLGRSLSHFQKFLHCHNFRPTQWLRGFIHVFLLEQLRGKGKVDS